MYFVLGPAFKKFNIMLLKSNSVFVCSCSLMFIIVLKNPLYESIYHLLTSLWDEDIINNVWICFLVWLAIHFFRVHTYDYAGGVIGIGFNHL